MRRSIIAVIAVLLVLVVVGETLCRAQPKKSVSAELIPAQFDDISIFLSPIKNTNKTSLESKVTGLIVPHHLLAVDMIAGTFTVASHNNYDSVVVISPDHYYLGSTTISIAPSGFKTVFGDLYIDKGIFSALSKIPNVSSADFFYREHGIGAELPFIKYFFPNAKIIAIAIKETASQSEMDILIDVLENSVSQNTLVVQSTDFSHYLKPAAAVQKDMASERVLEANVPNGAFSLKQPDNIDSTAALYVQMRLQKEFFHSTLKIIDHKNSQDYTKDIVDSSTSYFTAIYTK